MKSTELDLRHAWRRIRKTPGFSFTVILTLSLSMAATATLFTLVNKVLLAPLSFPDSERIVEIRHQAPGIGTLDLDLTRGAFFHYRRNTRSLASMALYVPQPVNLSTPDTPQRARAVLATGSLFEVLATPPLLGRVFTPEESRPGADPVAVLSYGLWQRTYGGDPQILGQNLRIAGTSFQVVGVMPEEFVFPDAETQLWLPLHVDPNSGRFGGFSERAVGRLREGISPAEAEAEINRLISSLPEAYPDGLSPAQINEIGLKMAIHPLKEYQTRGVAPVLWMLLMGTGGLLLIAFFNVGNLFLVRSERRGSEVAIRYALGARFWDVVRSFLSETMLMSTLAGALALVISYWAVHGLRFLGPASLPRLLELSIDARTVGLCAGLSLLAGLLLTAMSFLRQRVAPLAAALKGARRDGGSGLHTTGQKLLVSLQVALALMLLVAATLMLRTLIELRQVDPGFESHERLSFRLSLPLAQYPDRRSAAQFHRELLTELSSVPGVLSVGTTRCLPLQGWCGGDPLLPEGQSGETVAPPVAVKPINPDYFESMGIELISGRTLSWADQESGSGAAVITRALAEHYWPHQDPIGKRFRMTSTEGPWGRVVGVVDDIRLTGLRAEPGKIVYFPLLNRPGLRDLPIHDTTYVVHSAGADPLAILPALRSRLRQLDPELPMANIEPLTKIVDGATREEAFATLILLVLSVGANLMGALGLYGAMSYLVSQRTREIGLRMALGARALDVRWLVLREAAVLLLAGLLSGALASLAATRFLEGLLFGVSRNDPFSYGLVAVLLLTLGLASAALPARRAARLEPGEALHWEG